MAAASGVEAPARLRWTVGEPSFGLQVAVVLTAIPLALSAFVLPLAGDHLAYPDAMALYSAFLVAAPIAVGLVWWRKRPATRFAALLVAFGLAAWPLSWVASDDAYLYNLGVLAEGSYLILNFFLILAFSTGRLQTRVDRWIMGVLALVVGVFFASQLLLQPVLMGPAPLSSCQGDCPENVFQIGSNDAFLSALGKFVTYVGLAAVAATIIVYIGRLRTATAPQRRNLIAVAVSSLLLLPALAVNYFALLVLGVGDRTAEVLGWLVVAAHVVFPLGFALALVQADVFAAQALRRLLVELVRRPTPEHWRTVVAGALDDPSLRLGFWDSRRREFRQSDGSALLAPRPGSARQWVDVSRGSLPVAAMVTDGALADDPELVDAAVSATLVAVEKGHLEGELRASQARAVAAGDQARRRIGRDLHDSAQQRLVALRLHLALARDQFERPEDRETVERLGSQLDEALEELRTIAHGLFPQHLERYGVAEALRSASLNGAVPVEVRDDGLHRHAAPIELSVYFCCREALQNAAKHAGEGARVTVRLWEDDGAVRFEVEDDGVGFDPSIVEPGDGLANLADRLAAVGGSLEIDSTPCRGARIAGIIPL